MRNDCGSGWGCTCNPDIPDVLFKCRCSSDWLHHTSGIPALPKLKKETSLTVHVQNQNVLVSCVMSQTKQNSDTAAAAAVHTSRLAGLTLSKHHSGASEAADTLTRYKLQESSSSALKCLQTSLHQFYHGLCWAHQLSSSLHQTAGYNYKCPFTESTDQGK